MYTTLRQTETSLYLQIVHNIIMYFYVRTDFNFERKMSLKNIIYLH